MKDSLIIAVDFSTKKEVESFLQHFKGEKLFLKVGMELFYQEGPRIVTFLKEQGHQVFLDLKLHDIPNTVYRAMKGIASIGVDLVNVHAAGGQEMMQAAREGLEAGTNVGGNRPYCVAVTQLTSTTEEQMIKEQLINTSLEDSVLHYATLSKEAGLDGVVCSVHESVYIHKKLGSEFLTICPGVRPANSDIQDQKRVATPTFAGSIGVSAIVIGRPITQATNPFESYQLLLNDWRGVKA
ncbi:orotidine-5'-phosphate decarboxylase [Pseudoneobacillus rhizosphaerae]|uniref:Orotidine 5'-phosphate decarboxylase n=1 Tax=Pseudoneobacillus rhizosphaerae TaxID=2880968 RepID=A0A9C7G7G7_9BACI|nr:orotidine-5'-phosphate decarboxylase [Pseudoneobacillus rhizosphaerae]CAG9607476.1 Orotidine 5'-phosphate decarboxylase [Pseudoneobacillus rhizosphaerae]